MRNNASRLLTGHHDLLHSYYSFYSGWFFPVIVGAMTNINIYFCAIDIFNWAFYIFIQSRNCDKTLIEREPFVWNVLFIAWNSWLSMYYQSLTETCSFKSFFFHVFQNHSWCHRIVLIIKSCRMINATRLIHVFKTQIVECFI